MCLSPSETTRPGAIRTESHTAGWEVQEEEAGISGEEGPGILPIPSFYERRSTVHKLDIWVDYKWSQLH